MLIGFASDYQNGSSPCGIFEHMEDLAGKHQSQRSLVYRSVCESKHYDSIKIYDIGITNNSRFLRQAQFEPNRGGSLTVNTHGGQGFLGDAKPEQGIDVCLAASEHEKEMYCRNGYREQDVLVTGRPRTDVLYGTTEELDALRQIFLKSKYLNYTKRTVLYAPTWDRSPFGGGKKGFFARWIGVEAEVKVMSQILERIKELDMNLVVRLHGRYAKNYQYGVPDHIYELVKDKDDVIITSMHTDPDSIPTLIASDVMITDLSSIAFDYLALNRPIIFIEPHAGWTYAPSDKRYCKLEDRPGVVVQSVLGLLASISGWDTYTDQDFKDARKLIAKKFLGFNDGRNADRAVDAIMEEYGRRVES